MKWLSNIYIGVALILFSSVSLADPNPQQAYQLVETKIDALLNEIRMTKSQPSLSDEEKIQLVDRELGSVVDFKRIAQRVMAKHYRKATDEQKQRFLAVFKSSLLNTYAKGLWEFNDYKVNMLPLKTGNQTLRNTQVGLEVITSSGEVFPVTQSLFYNKQAKQWMVQNVIINGINMGLLFRDQFTRLVTENKGDIDLAINAWTAEVASEKASQSASTNSDSKG